MRAGSFLATALLSAICGAAEQLDEVTVTATRLAEPAARAAYAVTRLSADEIANSPSLRLDEILKQVPGVSLFRRASSLVAHPTTQGVTLRGIGPNGAGRALVLLDGVPLNDPFGGWVFWSALDPARLAGAEVLRGSGAGPFGNQALTGVIRLDSRLPRDFELYGSARRGGFDTTGLSLGVGDRIGGTALSLSGQYFESDGFILRPKAQRGPVDVPAASDAASVAAAMETALSERATLGARLSWFEEDRNNGTKLTGNGADASDGAVRLVVDGGRAAPSVELAAYVTDRDFASRFSAVSDDRVTERPVLDQFRVPARAAGAVTIVRFPIGDDDVIEIGADARRLEGKTHERFRNLGDGFTRLRVAGGDQWLAGGWLEYAGRLGARLDYWRTFNGVLRERELADGTIVRDDAIRDRDGVLVNGRLGATYELTGALDLRLAGYTGFRLPTLNELFRPFRVGDNITEANPALDPERLYGLEAGVAYRPLERVRLRLDYFRNWLADGVGNVTLATGPGNFPPAGFVPEGGTLRQRRNIARILADGVETEARIALAMGSSGGLDAVLRHLLVRARVVKNPDFPALVGKRVAQSPEHTLSLGLDWRPARRWRTTVEARFVADRFEDDLNSRELDAAVTVDARLAYALTKNLGLFLAAENLLGATVESQIEADGLVTRAQARFVSGGARFSY